MASDGNDDPQLPPGMPSWVAPTVVPIVPLPGQEPYAPIGILDADEHSLLDGATQGARPVFPPTHIPQLSNKAFPPKSPLQSDTQGVTPVLPPVQTPQLSSEAVPPKSPLQSATQGVMPVLPPEQTPQLSSEAVPSGSPLQSSVPPMQMQFASHVSFVVVATPSSQAVPGKA